MKMKNLMLPLLLGTAVGTWAIERPGDKNSTVPEEPTGGILEESERDQARSENPNKPEELPKPEAPVSKVTYLGVSGSEVSEALKVHLEIDHGLLLETVDPSSPAGLAGLKKNDIILSVEEVDIFDQKTLREAVVAKAPGDMVVLDLIRRGESLQQEIALGETPDVRSLPPMALVPDPAAEMNRLMNERFESRLGAADFHREMMKQAERILGAHGKQMQQLRLEFPGNGAGQLEGLERFGSVSFVDQDGISVELKVNGEGRTVIVRDKDKSTLFEGPYNTEEDKRALPEEFRERVESLDMRSGKSGFSMKFGVPSPWESGDKEGE